MVDLFKDPRLDDYFVERNWRDIVAAPRENNLILQDFLSEKVSVVHGLNISALDFDFLETVKFPQTWGMKKFQFRTLLKAEPTDPIYRSVLSETFLGDVGRFTKFVEQLQIIDGIANGVVDRVLGHLNLSDIVLVARFSETRMENLHNDLDAGSDDHEAFRFYINLDAYPRIWATSYQMSTLLQRGGQRLLQYVDGDAPSELILKRAITSAYGGWHHRATERLSPRHQIYFDPGDVWVVDGRSVSHQVMSGYRVLSVYVKIPHSSNPELGPTFAQKVRKAYAEAMKVPIGSETAVVNYYTPSEIGSAASLKDDWAHVFGDTRTGRLRRFDDKGLATAA